jgi:hypothetical protein
VGTVPASNTEAAMRLMLAITGDHLKTIPDGETTAGREDWVVPTVLARLNHPDVVTLKRFNYDTLDFRPWHGGIATNRPGHKITEDTLGLRYDEHALEALTILDKLVWSWPTAPALQVGIASPLDLALFTFGPFAPRHYRAETNAALAAIGDVHYAAPSAVFQLELPLETYLVAQSPKRVQLRVANWCARRLANFIQCTAADTEWIIHLCVGDPHGQPLVTPTDVGPLVVLANAIAAHWPADHTLDAIHFPFADGTHTAPTNAAYYWDLRYLEVPDEVDLLAGVVTAEQGVEFTQAALDLIDHQMYLQWGVSTPCGLGRKPNAVIPILEKMAELAT